MLLKFQKESLIDSQTSGSEEDMKEEKDFMKHLTGKDKSRKGLILKKIERSLI
jgi:hypothetical protein